MFSWYSIYCKLIDWRHSTCKYSPLSVMFLYIHVAWGRGGENVCVCVCVHACVRSEKSHVASVDLPCLVVTHRADHCAVIMGQLERVSYRSVLTHHRELLVSRLRSIQCIVDNLSASGFFCQEEAEIVLQAVTKTDQVRTLDWKYRQELAIY